MTVVLAALLTAAAPQAHANLLTEETFTYGVGFNADVNLQGLNGGSGWGSSWQVGSPGAGYANDIRNNKYNLSYPAPSGATPAFSGGNYVNLAAGFSANNNFNYAQRYLDTSAGGSYGQSGYLTAGNADIGAKGTTLWGSFLYQAPNSGTQFWLRNSSGSTTSQFSLPSPGGDGSTGLELFRIEYSTSGPDKITFWTSPNLSTWTPDSTPTSTATGSYSFNLLIFVEDGANIEGRFDDVRFGSSFGDVVPVPEPATWGVGLLCSGLVAARWRRRKVQTVARETSVIPAV